jgi:hypothetical protein
MNRIVIRDMPDIKNPAYLIKPSGNFIYTFPQFGKQV